MMIIKVFCVGHGQRASQLFPLALDGGSLSQGVGVGRTRESLSFGAYAGFVHSKSINIGMRLLSTTTRHVCASLPRISPAIPSDPAAPRCAPPAGAPCSAAASRSGVFSQPLPPGSVSYTHLTLPTICSV
eukprot:910760-Rhodomonas_salina.1